MRLSYAFIGIILFFPIISLEAQDKVNVNFGKISPQDFILPSGTDTTHGAVVIADIGEGSFQGTKQGGFSFAFTRYKRVKIIDKKGFDAASNSIQVFTNGNGKQKVVDIKGATYNFENGRVVQTILANETVFADKINKNILEKKFTMPAVKEGSVIEYKYTTSSDFLFELQPWTFQGAYPCLWSEYKIGIPEFFNYIFLTQGYLKFDVNERNSSRKNYMLQFENISVNPDMYRISAMEFENRWVVKNIPPLKEEKFTSTINNYRRRIAFQLAGYREPYEPKKVLTDWTKTSDFLMKASFFGQSLSENNDWLNEEIKAICRGALTPRQNVEKIYTYVRDHFICTDYDAMATKHPLKEVFNKKSGNVAEINLLLIGMLRYNGIKAMPVLLSTRTNGFTHEEYPILGQYNYVICQAIIDNKSYYLDASHSYLGFNKLAADCYNGHARVVDVLSPIPVYFYADSLLERKTTTIFIEVDEKERGKLNGRVQKQLGYYESLAVRDELKEKGTEGFFKHIKSDYAFDVDIRNVAIDSIKAKEEPISIAYDFEFSAPDNGIIYIEPMMSEGLRENYFKSAERSYPVEMPYSSDETYVLNFQIPDGYRFEEIPKSAKVLLNENDGFFEYLIEIDEDVVRLKSRIKINKATFPAEDYQSLRNFFGFVVKKHAEQIVLKKK